jgi:CubicO group peptidase (beta-lactamase class C family)
MKTHQLEEGLVSTNPIQKKEYGTYPSPNLSTKTYGHTGFTGTMFWVDPEKQLTIVFLTNRVYPTRLNESFYDDNIRSKLIDILTENKLK